MRHTNGSDANPDGSDRSSHDVFAPVARDIADVTGYPVARQPRTKFPDQSDSFLLRNFKMGCSGYLVELVQVDLILHNK